MAPRLVIGSAVIAQHWKYMNATVVISRGIHGDEHRTALEDALARLCAEHGGLDVLIVPDLYHLPDRFTAWDAIVALIDCKAVVSWRYPRPIECLLASHGFASDAAVIDLGGFGSAEECFSAVAGVIWASDGRPGTISEIVEPVSERWYPVIDASRCTNCGHCLQFCIFDVYAHDGSGRVVAVSPDNCKPGCPACSRVCPEGAIIFPCYRKDTAIAGAPGEFVTPDASARRMLYARTKQPCPVCHRVHDSPRARTEAQDVDTCPECGAPLTEAPRPNQDVIDDIDLLINDLENLARRKP